MPFRDGRTAPGFRTPIRRQNRSSLRNLFQNRRRNAAFPRVHFSDQLFQAAETKNPQPVGSIYATPCAAPGSWRVASPIFRGTAPRIPLRSSRAPPPPRAAPVREALPAARSKPASGRDRSRRIVRPSSTAAWPRRARGRPYPGLFPPRPSRRSRRPPPDRRPSRRSRRRAPAPR